jgi:hypothetical protein
MSFSNTSVLISQQVPEFIREEYPLFIDFLKAYYEFLEQEQFDPDSGLSLKNNLTTQLKTVRDIVDVDKSVDQFEESFLNTFLSLVPKEAKVSKDFLIKNILPLYLSKGIDDSFKLLFKLLYDEEVEINLPKNNILRASDGKWTIDNSLKIERDVRNIYVGNGSKKEFYLVQPINFGDITVYVNDILKEENVDYEVRKESKKIIFTTAPTNNSEIKIVYNNFDYTLFNNRKIVGISSGASALVERSVEKIITDNLNFGLPFELFINPKTLSGSFINGEQIRSDIVDQNGELITITADTFSILTSITVIDGGRSYNVGDPILILGGGATTVATAEVESTEEFALARVAVDYGGVGYKLTESTYVGLIDGNPEVFISGYVDGVNNSHYTANSFTVLGSDIVSPYSEVTINSADYGMPSGLTENVNTRIVDALSKITVTGLGPITNALVIYSSQIADQSTIDTFQAALYTSGGIPFDIKGHRSIGRIDVVNGGLNYNVGDEVVFTNSNILETGAAAAVKTVNANGSILTIQMQPPRIDGTANVSNNGTIFFGTGTNFLSDLQVGDKIIYRNQETYVSSVISDTVMSSNIAISFSGGINSANNQKIGSYSKGIIGGTNYTQNNFPTLIVSSANGTGANVVVTSLIGDGANLRAVFDQLVGKILSIKLTSGGSGYKYIPKVDLGSIGGGNAIAEVTLGSSYTVFPGRWTTTDSIISSYERKLQGSNYYFDYSYVTSSLIPFTKYKNILKELLHPAGFVNYAIFDLLKDAKAKETNVSYVDKGTTISGFVSTTNNSIYITGTNTRFNIANTLSIFTIGSNVAVNNQIRTISSIISNTNLSVTSAFTMNSNTQQLTILT